ncbi:MAG: hypothetical protein Q9159_004295 [Coniocarpon cinnabarinum]
MSNPGIWEEREPGARRRKFAGYLRAANELRQTYQQNWNNRGLQQDGSQELPGSWPGASITSNGDVQLVLFPSYARRHKRKKPDSVSSAVHQRSNSGRDLADNGTFGEADFWRQEWAKYQNDKAVVDVDVRGWIFAPHRGPLSRKNKVLMSMARQLSGIPAPRTSPSSSMSTSRASSPHNFKDRLDARSSLQQEKIARKEVESVIRRGEAEAEVANQGGYSEQLGRSESDPDADSSGRQSRETSPTRYRNEFSQHRRNQAWSDEGDRRGQTAVIPSQMSQAEIATANANLLERVAPFMANPMQNSTISAFFYNDDASVMRNVETDASGHFTLRAALDFVPTHVRILASDKMSATEQVRIVEPRGVNVISDIDDTIKHTAMLNGAKEIFRNVFVRDVGELSIEGVRDWYNEMAKLGCEFHYVSNSPWQLYPLLSTFFKNAGLPPGSFHLKAYSGMLQGIFEPVAERKKVAIDQLMKDFPDRSFLLVGDSGEADLEVYTDTVRDYPGRVIGVLIRDVTTSKRRSFFNSMGSSNGTHDWPAPARPLTKPPDLQSSSNANKNYRTREDADIEAAIARSLADVGRPPEALERSLSRHEKSSSRGSSTRPALPPRPSTASTAAEENLIDLESDQGDRTPSPAGLPKNWLRPPPAPSKPRSLSATRIEGTQQIESSKENMTTSTGSKQPPPRPRKPSTSVHVTPSQTNPEKPPPLPLHSKPPPTGTHVPETTSIPKPPRPDPPPPRQTYRAAARQKFTDVYNRMPSPKDMVFGSRPGTPKSSPSHSRASSFTDSARDERNPSLADLMKVEQDERAPPLPPRKPGILRTSTFDSIRSTEEDDALAYGDQRSISSRQGSTASTYGGYSGYNPQTGQLLSKKEEAWLRRWDKAKRILEGYGVVLRSWRVGEDIKGEALRLVQDSVSDRQRGRKSEK